MIGLVLRRIAWAIVVAWFASTVAFALVTQLPADPLESMLGPHATAETIERARIHYCLDEGWLVQYGCWLDRLAHGDLGESYRTRRPVGELIADRIVPTLELAVAAVILALGIGVPLGVIAAMRRGRWQDRAVTLGGLVAQSAPPFVVGTVLMWVLAYRFDLLPTSGYGGLRHLVLPALTLGILGSGWYSRIMRSSMLDVLRADFIRTARAKGLGRARVVLGHALPNAILPIVAMIGIDIGMFMSGIVVVESVFGWPGIGQLAWQAIQRVDIPIIMGVTTVAAAFIILGNLLADLTTPLVDPRIRLR